MPNQNQIFYSFLIIAISLLAVFFAHVSAILLPFVIGLIIAYLLNPVVTKLKTRYTSRGFASFIVIACFMITLTSLYIIVGPILAADFVALLDNLPRALRSFEEFITPVYQKFIAHSRPGFFPQPQEVIAKISKSMLTLSATLLGNIWQSGIVLINLFSLMFITPVITFYLLKDWDQGIKHLQKLIPKRQSREINKLFREIDKILSAYIRGQTLICLMLGIFYAIALSIVGLNHGFLIGLLTGIFSIIPFFGVFIGMAIGVVVATFQFHSTIMVCIVLGVFVIGQFLEGNFITPNLVGNKIGIHPVIIIFTLLAGGNIFGFVGILFAIPSCAIAGVIIKTLILTYHKSKFFRFVANHKPRVKKSNG